MSTADEIETAIDHLPPDEYRRVIEWLRARDQAGWNQQIDQDSLDGKLDFLFAEADSDSAQGLLHDWPSQG